RFIVQQGTANFAAPSRFGSGTDAADFLTLDGGTALMNTTINWINGKQITVTANNGTFNKSSSQITTTFDKAIHGTAGGKLTVTTGNYIFSNTGNDWNGNLDISGSTTIQSGAAGVVPDGCVVTLLASGASLSLRSGYLIPPVTVTAGGSGYSSAPTV